MEYNLSSLYSIKSENYILKKNINKKNKFNDLLLKIKELINKLDFYKKYEKKIINNNLDIDNTTKIIDNLIIQLNKNIITNAQFIRNKNTNIKKLEFEF